MKAWITKYALTTGIYEVKTKYNHGKYPGIISVRSFYFPQRFYGEGREWHRTREDAVIRANEMREAKIASIRKQITKLSVPIK